MHPLISSDSAVGPPGRSAQARGAGVGLWRGLAALALFAALAVGHTWPLASAPGSLSRHDNGDAVLNEWTVAWVAHQLVRDPLNLFDANIFHPEPNTLAFSEHLFVQAVMGAPLLWAGASTLLVHNVLLIAGFTLTGWTMCLVIRRYTGDWPAAVLAGMLLAFNAHTLGRLAHLQAVHVEFLPLAVMALDRLLLDPAFRRAVTLAVLFALQGLTSNYLLVFSAFAMLGAGFVRAPELLGRGRRRTLGLALLAGLLAVLLLLPFLLPYREAQREQGLTRSLDEIATYAASWRDYLSASGRLHFDLWSSRFWRGTALFPGMTASLLAGFAVWAGVAWRDRFARMWLAIGIAGLVLSFGTLVPGYALLYELMPLLQGIRASVRFGFLALVGVAALAGFGLAHARARLSSRPRAVLTALALVLATAEAARVPVGYERAHHTPSLYRYFASQPEAVLVELPLYPPFRVHMNSHYMLHATMHWRPMLNGYSGYRPASYFRHYEALEAFPDPSALEYLRDLGVTHVVVHANRFVEVWGVEAFGRIDGAPGLQTLLRAGNMTIYRLLPGTE